jgi:hypothetical protein
VPDTTTQRRAFDFLLDHFRSQEPFTKSAFHGAVPEWSKSTLDTYWSKQIKRLLARAGQNQFRVTKAFRPYANWDSFRKHIATQVRRIFSDYTSLIYDDLIIYEFFMPLTNEGPLRTALDVLFYKDTILARLRTIGHQKGNKAPLENLWVVFRLSEPEFQYSAGTGRSVGRWNQRNVAVARRYGAR